MKRPRSVSKKRELKTFPLCKGEKVAIPEGFPAIVMDDHKKRRFRKIKIFGPSGEKIVRILPAGILRRISGRNFGQLLAVLGGHARAGKK